VPRRTVATAAAAEVERDDDAVALPDALDALADGDHPAGRLVARYLSERGGVVGPLPVAHPGVPVRPADAAGLDRHHGPVRVGLGRVDRLQRERLAVRPQHCRAHAGPDRDWR
jgi:hypothetical protein